MNDFEALAKILMKPIIREMSDNYYFRHGLEQGNKVAGEVTVKLAKALEDEFELGWKAGQQALAQELQKKLVGGHKRRS